LNESSNYNQSWAGKYIVELSEKYNNNELTVENMNNKISILYNRLEYPDWLVMLSRNCEYATDIEYFRRLFEDELAYISGLWKTSANIEDFNKKYDRKVSNTHDIPGSLISRRDNDL
jgi:Mor family transcriptional regulator